MPIVAILLPLLRVTILAEDLCVVVGTIQANVVSVLACHSRRNAGHRDLQVLSMWCKGQHLAMQLPRMSSFPRKGHNRNLHSVLVMPPEPRSSLCSQSELHTAES